MLEIKGAFRVTKVNPITLNVQYTVLFLNDRMVFVRTGGQFGGMFSSQEKRNQQFQQWSQMSADEIVSGHKNNFQVLYGEVGEIEMDDSESGMGGPRTGVLAIVRGKKEKFDITAGQDFEACRAIVRAAMPGKLVGNIAAGQREPAPAATSDPTYGTVRTGELEGREGQRQLSKRVKAGAHWFFLVAALSTVNAILLMTNSDTFFVTGLGTAYVTALVMKGSQGDEALVAAVMTLIIMAIFVALGLAARRGKNWAFFIGIALYALDGALMLVSREWFSAGFHGLALYFMVQGAAASLKLKKLDQTRETLA